jgi:hypothetical protein
MRFGKSAGVVLAALLLGSAPQPERGGALEQAFNWVVSLWEAVAADTGTGPAVQSPEVPPASGPDEGAHIDPDG